MQSQGNKGCKKAITKQNVVKEDRKMTTAERTKAENIVSELNKMTPIEREMVLSHLNGIVTGINIAENRKKDPSKEDKDDKAS